MWVVADQLKLKYGWLQLHVVKHLKFCKHQNRVYMHDLTQYAYNYPRHIYYLGLKTWVAVWSVHGLHLLY